MILTLSEKILNSLKNQQKKKAIKMSTSKPFLKLDDERKEALKVVEDLRKERNETAAKMKGGKPSDDLIKKGKEIKEKLATEEKVLEEAENKIKEGLKNVPNIIFEDVPLGPEENSVEIRKWGKNKEKASIISILQLIKTGSISNAAQKLLVRNSIILKVISHFSKMHFFSLDLKSR